MDVTTRICKAASTSSINTGAFFTLFVTAYSALFHSNNIQRDPLCTGFDLLLVSVRRRLPLHDDDGTNCFRTT